jgi:hypothetical protein
MFPNKITQKDLRIVLKNWCALWNAGAHGAVEFKCTEFFSIHNPMDVRNHLKTDPDLNICDASIEIIAMNFQFAHDAYKTNPFKQVILLLQTVLFILTRADSDRADTIFNMEQRGEVLQVNCPPQTLLKGSFSTSLQQKVTPSVTMETQVGVEPVITTKTDSNDERPLDKVTDGRILSRVPTKFKRMTYPEESDLIKINLLTQEEIENFCDQLSQNLIHFNETSLSFYSWKRTNGMIQVLILKIQVACRNQTEVLDHIGDLLFSMVPRDLRVWLGDSVNDFIESLLYPHR